MGGGRRGEREKGGRSGEGEGGEATIWNPSRWVRKISLVGVIIKKYVSLRSEPHRHVSLLSLSSLYLPLYLAAGSLSLSLSLALAILAKRTRILSYIIHDTMCFNDETFAVDSNRCRANRALFRSLLSRPSGGRGEGGERMVRPRASINRCVSSFRPPCSTKPFPPLHRHETR